MTWEKLLKNAGLRLGKSTSASETTRTDFQRDFDRIVFSPAFRRLQNKTQVLPLPKSDFVRNRLTHSLETASVGRSLGVIVGQQIIKKYNLNFSPADFGAIISAACLTHDIGNPPFGHAGEEAISSYYKSEKGLKYIEKLTDKEKADLQNFEGNAAGFRIIANTLKGQSEFEGGLRLTYATYATFTKYPKESLPNLKVKGGKASQKKYGFFQTEKDVYKEIAKKLSLNNNSFDDHLVYDRFPLAFLVEAADDICYSIIDFEDGFNIGYISFETIEENLIALLASEWSFHEEKYNQIHEESSKVAYLRSMAINYLVNKSAAIFLKNEQEIINGTYDKPLTDNLDDADQKVLNKIIKESINKIYQSPTVLKLEVAGFKVLPNLLDHFVGAILNPKENKYCFKLIPSDYLVDGKPLTSDYENILNMTMYVSSMTDRHAVELFKNLNGISLADY